MIKLIITFSIIFLAGCGSPEKSLVCDGKFIAKDYFISYKRGGSFYIGDGTYYTPKPGETCKILYGS